MTTLDFFRARFAELGPGETIEIRPIHATSGRHHPRAFCATPEEAAAVVAAVPASFEVYYTVNPRRGQDGTKEGVSRIFALFADADDKHFGNDAEASLAAIMGFELPPTGVVRTGRGWHAYWHIDPLDARRWRDQVEHLQRRLYLRLGGLDAVQDISRILRVPGTQNWKDPANPQPVYVEYWSGRTYSVDEFGPYLPALPPAEVNYREVAHALGEGDKPSLDKLRELLAYIDPNLPYAEYYLVWAAVAYYYPDDDGLTLVDEWSTEARAAAGQYSSPRNQPEKHAGFRRQTGRVATLGTLIHYAKLGGYVPPTSPLNLVTRGKRGREIAARLEDLPDPPYDELPHFLRRMYDHLGPLVDGMARDLVTVTSLTAFSICWPGIKFENLPLNLFVNLIMEQGSGKSVVTEELERLFRLVWGEKIGYFTGGSPQGMYAALNKSSGKSLYVAFDEFGDFLATLRQEYMAGARGDLNKLYDGRAINHQRSRDGIAIENPHVVLIATTTPRVFIDHVTDHDLEGGFASRFWYLAPSWENKGRRGSPSTAARAAFANEIREHVESLSHVTLARFDAPDHTPPGAYAAYETLCGVGTGERRTIHDAVNSPVSPKGRYLARVKRVAANLELLGIRPRIHGNAVVVREQYLRLAITLVRRCEVYADIILDLVAGTEDEAALAKIRRVLARREAGLTKSELMQQAHLKAQQLARLLPVLEEGGELREVYEGEKTLYRLSGAGPHLRIVRSAAD